MISFTFRPLYTRGKRTLLLLDRGLGSPRAGRDVALYSHISAQCENGIWAACSQASRFTDWAVSAHDDDVSFIVKVVLPSTTRNLESLDAGEGLTVPAKYSNTDMQLSRRGYVYTAPTVNFMLLLIQCVSIAVTVSFLFLPILFCFFLLSCLLSKLWTFRHWECWDGTFKKKRPLLLPPTCLPT